MANQKPVKDKWLGARVDATLESRVNAYIAPDAADMTMGDLIRKSVNEYMLNHPVKQPVPEQSLLTKPGE